MTIHLSIPSIYECVTPDYEQIEFRYNQYFHTQMNSKFFMDLEMSERLNSTE